MVAGAGNRVGLAQLRFHALERDDAADVRAMGKAKTFSAYVYTWGEYHASGLGPNGRSLEEIARTVREWHAMGVRILYYCGGDYNWGVLGPQYYLAAALQSDITGNEKQLLQEYCETAYGNAAGTMQQFFEGVHAWRAYKIDSGPATAELLARQLDARKKSIDTIQSLPRTEPEFAAKPQPNPTHDNHG